MRFNVNDKVRVRLTREGRKALVDQHTELKKMFPSAQYCAPSEDSDGWSEWQLWELMNTFGKYCQLGLRPPFETEIDIPVESTGEPHGS